MSNEIPPGPVEEKVIENGHTGVSAQSTLENQGAALDEKADALDVTTKNASALEANDGGDRQGSSRSDSEAETVVPSGKDELTNGNERKAFRHGSESLPKTTPVPSTQDRVTKLTIESAPVVNGSFNATDEDAVREKDLAVPVDTNNSSNLSSTHSSPAQPTHSPTRNGIESPRQQSPPEELRSRKRKRRNTSGVEDQLRRRASSAHGTKSKIKGETEFLEPSRPSLQRNPKARSGSPQTHGGSRSSDSTEHQQTAKRRKPPPLLMSHSRKDSEDAQGESDDSTSLRAHTLPRRLVSHDSSTMSPAKTPHKKLRDRNGRTQLARACAVDEVGPVQARLAERPQDLDVADNAGNTPLQIASLEGHADVVRILLSAGCDIYCKNSDNDTPLIDAVENGHLDVVKLLLDAGLDPRQTNAQGEEPLELLKPDNDNYDEIRAALNEAKANDGKRRYSEDNQSNPNNVKDGGSPTSPRASPTSHSARSPPNPHAPLPRRRTARSETTRNDVLWIHPTPENLRDKAGRGDLQRVGYILNMGTQVDTETVLGAARGGHKDVLDLLIAMGQPDADPNPLRGHKPGSNTPMLAAIGRGNIGVVSLLLSQPGFDPTRRVWEGKSYYEIAKERQGPFFQEEYKMLKDAYDKFKARKSNSRSPNQVREKKSRRTATSSPCRDEARNQNAEGTNESSKLRKGLQAERRGDGQSNGHAKKKHLRVPSRGSRDSSIAISDQDTRSVSPAGRKSKRSSSNRALPLSDDKEAVKPRRKLVSGKEFKSHQDHKRRASLVSNASSSSSTHKRKHSTDEKPILPAKEEGLTGSSEADVKVPIKRIRKVSSSPRSSDETRLRRKSSDVVQKIKRRRVDSNGKAIEPATRDVAQIKAPPVANMIKTPLKNSSSVVSSGTAPIAIMGKAPASPSASPVKTTPNLSPRSPDNMISTDGQQQKYVQDLQEQIKAEQTLYRQQLLENEQAYSDGPNQKKSPTSLSEAAKQGFTPSPSDSDSREVFNRTEVDPALKESINRENVQPAEEVRYKAQEDERLEREGEIARQKRERFLANQQIELERLRKEEVRQAEIQKAEETEREAQVAREEEKARQEKQAREEEQQKRRRAELERHRREEQEKKRLEQEEYEQMMRLRRQEEEERRKRELLPNGLRRMAELPADHAKSVKEVKRWLPLYTVTSEQLGTDKENDQERWIANIQAATVLGVGDLGLSQYTAWTKLPATPPQRLSLWRILRCKLSHIEQPPYRLPDVREDIARDIETQVKFEALEQVFWIRLSDFTDIAARSQHLSYVDLKCAPMALERATPATVPTNGGDLVGNGLPSGEKASPSLSNGNGALVNGWH